MLAKPEGSPVPSLEEISFLPGLDFPSVDDRKLLWLIGHGSDPLSWSEHPFENRVDMFEVMVEVEQLLELLVREARVDL